MIRLAALALALGIVLVTSVMMGVRSVPLSARLLFALGLLCLVGSVAVGIFSRPRTVTSQQDPR